MSGLVSQANILFAIGKLRRDGLGGCECAEKGIEAVEAMLRKTQLLNLRPRLDELRLDVGHGEVGSERGGGGRGGGTGEPGFVERGDGAHDLFHARAEAAYTRRRVFLFLHQLCYIYARGSAHPERGLRVLHGVPRRGEVKEHWGASVEQRERRGGEEVF